MLNRQLAVRMRWICKASRKFFPIPLLSPNHIVCYFMFKPQHDDANLSFPFSFPFPPRNALVFRSLIYLYIHLLPANLFLLLAFLSLSSSFPSQLAITNLFPFRVDRKIFLLFFIFYSFSTSFSLTHSLFLLN